MPDPDTTVEHWAAVAVCRNSGQDWFPQDGNDRELTRGAEVNRLKSICRSACPVIRECAAVGLREQHGIWGGLDNRERIQVFRLVKAGAPLAVAHESVTQRGMFT